MKFTKMEGAGNDYVYVDCFSETLPEPPRLLPERFPTGISVSEVTAWF